MGGGGGGAGSEGKVGDGGGAVAEGTAGFESCGPRNPSGGTSGKMARE